ncbi:ABC transporter permease [Candidatus Bipolaricaulota bacterium]|nr:ABC transporter permease [Candidatus Bipolaricaulota bacterium]MBS3825808.1 ABC transporter permease [Candidatus Bipolaricaulota bacterium]
MTSYIIRRLGQIVLVLFVVSVLIFTLLQLAPGDPATVMAGPGTSIEELESIRQDLGLNKPIHMQYFTFVKKLFNGTLKSYAYKQPVISIIAERFPATLELGLFAIILATIVSIPAGIISAIWQDTTADYTVTTVALLGISTPVFWTALMLMLLLSIQFDALPVSGRGATLWGFSIFTLDGLRHIVIPMIALSSVQMAMNTRLTRSSMLEVLREDYITTARSKGLKENVVILGHAFRNGVLPVMTNVGMMVGTMVAGAVLTETTTAWPGLGRLMVSSINRRDFAVIFALTLLISFGYVISYLIVDILYAYADPRITYE